jgi:hypothetical protein
MTKIITTLAFFITTFLAVNAQQYVVRHFDQRNL